MLNNKESRRQASNFLEQSKSVSSMLKPMDILQNVPCKSCGKTNTLKIEHEQSQTIVFQGVNLSYKCTNCGSKVETVVEF